MDKRILVFGSMGNIGPIVSGSLRENGAEVFSFDFPQNVLRDEFGYRNRLLKAIAEYQPQMIIPVGNTVALSRLRKELEEKFPKIVICVDSPEKIELLDSKVLFYEYAQTLGIPQPARYPSIESVPQEFNIVFKRDVSFGGHGVHLPRTGSALLNLIDHQPKGEPYLIEELLCGTDYSVDAVRSRKGFACSAYRCLKSKGKSGPSTEREIVRCTGLEKTAELILECLDFTGVCGFDFIVDDHGHPFLLEANPRFTGGLKTQLEAGFDIPEMLLRAFSAESL